MHEGDSKHLWRLTACGRWSEYAASVAGFRAMLDESISDCIDLLLHQLHRRAFGHDHAVAQSEAQPRQQPTTRALSQEGSAHSPQTMCAPAPAAGARQGAERFAEGVEQTPRRRWANEDDHGGAEAAVGGGSSRTCSMAQLAPTIANVFPSILSARSPHSPFHAALKGPSRETCRLLSIAEF